MKYIDQLELTGKRVLIRADLDVPMDADSNISDDHRLKAALPTLKYAVSKGAKLIIAGHMGRPKGHVVSSLSLAPVAERLSLLLEKQVKFADNCIGDTASLVIEQLQDGDVCLLENLRFHPGEEANDPKFAASLAAHAEVYVNNAFATAHRAHASTAGVPKIIHEHGAGLTIKDEVEYFNKALSRPERPLLVIFGGAKISTKMKAVCAVSKTADKIIVGGAMANTFFAAAGYDVQKSLFEKEEIDTALQVQKLVKENNCELFLPQDVITAAEMKEGAETSVAAIDKIPPGHMALDVGPATNKEFSEVIESAKTIVWNGPMGAFEITEFSSGTYNIVEALVKSSALRVVGGGDTDLALHKKNAAEKMSFVSTGGGAFLKLLEGEKLPALTALE